MNTNCAVCFDTRTLVVSRNFLKKASVPFSEEYDMLARLTKQHNNANVLALGGRTTPVKEALEIVDAWLDADFEGGRHQRRVDMLDSI